MKYHLTSFNVGNLVSPRNELDVVNGAAYEVYRTRETPLLGYYDVELADDVSSILTMASQQEQVVMFVRAVALHGHGL